LATISVPTLPPAPPLLSITTCCPRSAVMPTATTRAIRSVGPPGGNGTTSRIGLSGYCAMALAHDSSAATPRASAHLVKRIDRLSPCTVVVGAADRPTLSAS
jgi:hypothetical protein